MAHQWVLYSGLMTAETCYPDFSYLEFPTFSNSNHFPYVILFQSFAISYLEPLLSQTFFISYETSR